MPKPSRALGGTRSLITLMAAIVIAAAICFSVALTRSGPDASASTSRTGGTGVVRAWAHVEANGKIIASGGGARINRHVAASIPGSYSITWKNVKLGRDCATIANIGTPSEGADYPNGYAVAGSYRVKVAGGKHRSITQVSTFVVRSKLTEPRQLGFDVAVICH